MPALPLFPNFPDFILHVSITQYFSSDEMHPEIQLLRVASICLGFILLLSGPESHWQTLTPFISSGMTKNVTSHPGLRRKASNMPNTKVLNTSQYPCVVNIISDWDIRYEIDLVRSLHYLLIIYGVFNINDMIRIYCRFQVPQTIGWYQFSDFKPCITWIRFKQT